MLCGGACGRKLNKNIAIFRQNSDVSRKIFSYSPSFRRKQDGGRKLDGDMPGFSTGMAKKSKTRCKYV